MPSAAVEVRIKWVEEMRDMVQAELIASLDQLIESYLAEFESQRAAYHSGKELKSFAEWVEDRVGVGEIEESPGWSDD